MKQTKNKEFHLKNFIILMIAGIINAFGVSIFLFPLKLYDSGISGLSMLLDQVTPPYITLSLLLLILNIPLFLFGLKKQGLAFTVYSLLTITVYSVMSYLIMNILPIDVEFASPLAGTDLLLCAIFGGVISGVGSGITIRFGGAIDGIDVLSVIFAKRIGLSVGSFVMIFNAVLYIVCGFVLNSWILPLYSVVTYFIGSRMVDAVVDGFNRSKCAMIITVEASKMTTALNEMFQSSGTVVNAVGGYSNEPKEIIFFVVNSLQIYKMRQVVHQIDPSAFISLHDVSDVIRRTGIEEGNKK